MYSLVVVGINYSGICCFFSFYNLVIVFIDGCVYGIFVNKLFGIIVFCIWFFFCFGINNGICCYCIGFDDLLVFIINDGFCGYCFFMYLLFVIIQCGVYSLFLKVLFVFGIDNCV